MIRVVKGDLIKIAKKGYFDAIAHGCNSFCVMGAGIALGIKHTFPEAYAADLKTKKGDIDKLGTISFATINELTVFNCYTQYDTGIKDGKIPLSYEALESSLKKVKSKTDGCAIGMPLIGYGLAGGDLIPILEIIFKVFKANDLTIVVFDKDPKANDLVETITDFFSVRYQMDLKEL